MLTLHTKWKKSKIKDESGAYDKKTKEAEEVVKRPSGKARENQPIVEIIRGGAFIYFSDVALRSLYTIFLRSPEDMIVIGGNEIFVFFSGSFPLYGEILVDFLCLAGYVSTVDVLMFSGRSL